METTNKSLFISAVLVLCCGLGEAVTTYYMDVNCGQTIYASSLYAFKLKLTSHSSYTTGMQCTVTIQGDFNKRLMMYFRERDIYYTGTCSTDWLEVHDGPSKSSSLVPGLESRICGYRSSASSVYLSTSNQVTLYFQSSTALHFNKGFEMMFTQFHYGACSSNEYDCDNGRCIEESITCNGYNPCGDHSDCPLTGGAIAGIVIGCFFFVVIVVTVAVICRRRRRMVFMKGPTTVISTTTTHPPPASYGGTTNYGYNQPPAYNQPPQPQGAYPPPAGGYTPAGAYQQQPAGAYPPQ